MSLINNKSCTVAVPRQRNYATLVGENATCDTTNYATTDLKALADKVLERNQQRNFDATKAREQRNFSHKNDSEKLPYPVAYSCFKLYELKEAAGDDWFDIKDNPNMLSAFAAALRDSVKRSIDVIPEHYTKEVNCQSCGTVKLWVDCQDVVQGCPWCLTKRNK